MTVNNPFDFTAAAPAEAQAAPAAEHVPTPYDALCADTTRPAAFAMTFVEPLAA